MSEFNTKNIICNLKRAHPFIDKIEEINCREYMKEYISRNNKNKKIKLKFNNNLFIKSLLEYNKIMLNNLKQSNHIKKEENKIGLRNNFKNEILNKRKIIKKNIRLKKTLSYNNLDDEKDTAIFYDKTNRLNIFRKINKSKIFKRSSSSKQEYLKFLERKSLSLRANFIMNNKQNTRGGKQNIRARYNPLNV